MLIKIIHTIMSRAKKLVEAAINLYNGNPNLDIFDEGKFCLCKQ